jgi:hypothetical protein
MIQLLCALLFSGTAHAWDHHQLLMERILSGPMADGRPFLSQKISVPCIEEERIEMARLANELKVNLAKIPTFSTNTCGKKSTNSEMMVRALLGSTMVDEPDLGMDQDLPEDADPSHFRKWMGGKVGPTSQGFRHMYFSGMKWSSPIRSLQIPFGALGEALERIETLRKVSDSYFKQKKYFWGLRVLAWELHYVQDLQQPFHVAQVPDLSMLPWSKWYSGFVGHSTHAVSNYHYAYEGLMHELLREDSEGSLQYCLKSPGSEPFRQASDLISAPKEQASMIGRWIYTLIGDYAKSPTVNLPEGIGQIDYFQLIHAQVPTISPEEVAELPADEKKGLQEAEKIRTAIRELKATTCGLYQQLSRWVWGEIDRNSSVLIQSSSIKTGK